VFPRKSYALTNLPEDLMTIDGLEYYDQMCMLKGGIVFADRVTTVSPQYAKEIQTPEFGNGMDGVIGTRLDDLYGLLNGIDTAVWNPGTDPALPARYTIDDLGGKAVCRARLMREFDWHARFRGPVFGMVCRFTPGKGLDLILGAREFFEKENCRLVVLGGGEKKYEVLIREFAAAMPAKVGVCVKHDEAMSHLVEAGADFFLMPSLFEPCGLNQMYSLRYGTIPIVRATGGLDDSVIDWTQNPRLATGIKFFEYNSRSLAKAIRKALVLFNQPKLFQICRRNAMKADFSWERTVHNYVSVYEKCRQLEKIN
jgi:starch synthase